MSNRETSFVASRCRLAQAIGEVLTGSGRAFGVGGAALALICAQEAGAASIVVDVATDTSLAAQCSLRDAITASDTDAAVNGCAAGDVASTDTITFTLPPASTIPLASSLPALNGPGALTVQGPGAAALTIVGGPGFTLFSVVGTMPALTISGITLDTGSTAIATAFNTTPALSLTDSVVSNTSAGIQNFGSGALTIARAEFINNQFAVRHDPSISGAGGFTLRDSTFTGSLSAVTVDAAVFNTVVTMDALIENCSFDGNQAQAGGSDIHAHAAYGGTLNLTLRNTTLAGDSNSGVSLLLDTTTFGTPGVLNATVASSLFLRPSGTNIDTLPGGTIALTANNSFFTELQAGIPETAAGSGNLFGQTAVQAALAALADNGGPTRTRALQLGSVAINAGSNPGALAFDQRGTGFPRVIGATADIGAFEAAPNIEVFDAGNTIAIADGDLVPGAADGTDFGSTSVGVGVARTFTIRNSGIAPLDISSLTSDNPAFVVSGAPASVAPNASATFTVTFTPSAAGPTSGQILIQHSDPDFSGTPYNFAVQGTGVATQNIQVANGANTVVIADGDVTPAAGDGTDFGSTNVGVPVTRTFTVRNTGGSPLAISSITSSAGSFTVSNVPASVAAGGTATFDVTFGAAAAGPANATITVNSNDPDAADASYTFAVTATAATLQNIQVYDPTNVVQIADGDFTPSPSDGTDFGGLPAGTSTARSFTIRNSGSQPLTIASITSNSPAFVVSGVPASIPGGSSATFTVTFTAGFGTSTAVITIVSNDPDAADASFGFALQGSAIQPVVAVPTLSTWIMGLLGALLVAFGFARGRRGAGDRR